MKLTVLSVSACALLLCVLVGAGGQDLRLECSETGTPLLLKWSGARNVIEAMINRLFKCLEKTAANSYKVLMTIVKDVSGCVTKLPTDFFKCLAKADVPQKLAEIINTAMETIRCVS